ncbi:unnamed protein product [Lupinus luteus]|uniref:Uncharacterized protein n=1 Tax=Lupinus luteus TaxID=3873 RepID=A0AAV1Y0K9_LUPLU
MKQIEKVIEIEINNEMNEPRKDFPVWLDYASCMAQLAVFGIFGVMFLSFA